MSRSFPPLHLVNPRNLSPQGTRDWSYPSVVWKNEEKGSDVSLGARMVFDRCNGAYDIAVIVSNDSDLLEPVRLVVQELGLPVYAILPANDWTKRQRRKSVFEGRVSAVAVTHISWSTLRKCQFPEVIRTADGEVRKPRAWAELPLCHLLNLPPGYLVWLTEQGMMLTTVNLGGVQR